MTDGIGGVGKIAPSAFAEIRTPSKTIIYVTSTITVEPTSLGARVYLVNDFFKVLVAEGTTPFTVEMNIRISHFAWIRIENLSTTNEISYGWTGVVQ